MEIIQDIKNDILNRREIKIIIPAEKTISYTEAAKLVADHFKAHEDNLVILGVKGKFGRKTFLIEADIYNSKEAKEKIERKPKKKKGAVPEA